MSDDKRKELLVLLGNGIRILTEIKSAPVVDFAKYRRIHSAMGVMRKKLGDKVASDGKS